MTEDIDRAYQLRHLDAIFREARFSPHFKPNPKFPDDGQHVFRIAYADVMAFKYIIREAPLDAEQTCWSADTKIVAHYTTAEALVGDGWRLD